VREIIPQLLAGQAGVVSVAPVGAVSVAENAGTVAPEDYTVSVAPGTKT
jgi:hypothetical protein